MQPMCALTLTLTLILFLADAAHVRARARLVEMAPQDTNAVQYALLRLLSERYANVAAVARRTARAERMRSP